MVRFARARPGRGHVVPGRILWPRSATWPHANAREAGEGEKEEKGDLKSTWHSGSNLICCF